MTFSTTCPTYIPFKLTSGDLLVVDEQIVEPGQLRTRFVQVGKHIAISPGAVERFLERYAAAYNLSSKSQALMSVPAAHHGLLWISPFYGWQRKSR